MHESSAADQRQADSLRESWLSLLDEIAAEEGLNEREFAARLMMTASDVPGVDSVQVLLLEPKAQQAQLTWLGIDGDFSLGEWSPIAESPWRDALSHGECWLESMAVDAPLPSVPALESPFHDRCLLPLRHGQRVLALLLMQSRDASCFSEWPVAQMRWLARGLGSSLCEIQTHDRLQARLDTHRRNAVLHPPALEGMLRLSRALLLETSPVLTATQFNLNALQHYAEQLNETLEFYLDEIRLCAGQEAVERVNGYAEKHQISDMLSDLDELVRDMVEGTFQLRTLLRHLKEIDSHQTMPGPVHLPELLGPLLPLAFAEKLSQLRIIKRWQSQQPIYARASALQQAFLATLFALHPHIEAQGEHNNTVEVLSEEEDRDIVLRLRFPTPLSSRELNRELTDFLLFPRHVVEESQGSFSLVVDEGRGCLEVRFPVMFDERSEPDPSGMFYSLPAAPIMDLPALSAVGDGPEEQSPSSTAKSFLVGNRSLGKLLLVGEDKSYLRALRRGLGMRHDILLAHSMSTAMEILHAHNDLKLVLCDFQERAEVSLELIDELQTQTMPFQHHLCFLEGERLGPRAESFLRRRAGLSCPRNSPIQTIEKFIREHIIPT